MEPRSNNRRFHTHPADQSELNDDTGAFYDAQDFDNPLINSAADQNGTTNRNYPTTRRNQDSIYFQPTMNVTDRSSNPMAPFGAALPQPDVDNDVALALILQEEEYSQPSFRPSHSDKPSLNNAAASNYITNLNSSLMVSDAEYAAHLQAEENHRQRQEQRNRGGISNPPRNQIRNSHPPPPLHPPNLRRPIIRNHSRFTDEVSLFPIDTSGNHDLDNNAPVDIENHDRDFGPEDYMRLLQLDDSSKKKALTVQQINRLPTEKFRLLPNSNPEENKCSVCMDDFKQDEVLRRLRCLHRYHKDCIDNWLKRSNLCPICRTETNE